VLLDDTSAWGKGALLPAGRKFCKITKKPALEKSGWPKKKFDEKDAFFQVNVSFDYKFSFQVPLK
jgi:hypothetical protein